MRYPSQPFRPARTGCLFAIVLLELTAPFAARAAEITREGAFYRIAPL